MIFLLLLASFMAYAVTCLQGNVFSKPIVDVLNFDVNLYSNKIRIKVRGSKFLHFSERLTVSPVLV